jgi:RimJ/RimL family protein N-acetyltransferase
VNGTLVWPTAPLLSGTTPAGRYLVREAGSQDAALISEFVSGLSVQSQYFRFFTAVAPPSAGLLRVLSDSSRADLLVVTDDRGTVVGHGMAVDAVRADGTSADIGLAMADAWQGQGLGTMLLDLLMARAAARGVTRLEFEVLPDNTRMLRIIDRRWPGASRTRTTDSVCIRADLGEWRQAAVAPQPPAREMRAPAFRGAPHESRAHAA